MQQQQLAKLTFEVFVNRHKQPKYKIILGKSKSILARLTLAFAICNSILINLFNLKDFNSSKNQRLKINPVVVISSNHNNCSDFHTKDLSKNDIITDSHEQLPNEDEEVITYEKESEIDNKQHIVSNGDNITSILTQYGLYPDDIAALTNQHLALRNLQIGQKLSWVLNKDGKLQTLKWIISQHEIYIYTRQISSSNFHENKKMHQGVWSRYNKIIKGKIHGNFASSVIKAGLTQSEAQEFYKALQWQIDFRKLKSGDKFSVLLSCESIDGHKHKEQSKLIGVRLMTNSKNYYAFRSESGHYYDSEANGLELGFLRFPTQKTFKVSSHFSLCRVNPTTGRLAPHKGVDLSMPVGTPIIAVGDGEVIVAKYSGAAGNFITIRHGTQYTSRYMHLFKLLVKPGQKVKRGERIALSGNTGRTTGPHLHYELWFNKRAVNPLTANLPTSKVLVGKDRKIYLSLVKVNKSKLKID